MIVIEGETARQWMRRMKTYRKKVNVLAVQMPDDFTIRQEGVLQVSGTVVGRKGSYLAMNEEGTAQLYPVPEDQFTRIYEEVIE